MVTVGEREADNRNIEREMDEQIGGTITGCKGCDFMRT